MGNVYFNRAVLKTLSAASKPRKDKLTAERYKFNCINCKKKHFYKHFFKKFDKGTFQEHQAESLDERKQKDEYKRRNIYIILLAELLKSTELSGEIYYADCSVLFTFKYLKS